MCVLRLLRPFESADPLCPRCVYRSVPSASGSEVVRYRGNLYIVSFCPRLFFIVPLYPHADKLERPLCPIILT